jgi:hypothetical protein
VVGLRLICARGGDVNDGSRRIRRRVASREEGNAQPTQYIWRRETNRNLGILLFLDVVAFSLHATVLRQLEIGRKGVVDK